jgi:hypothetical protein
MAKPSPDDLLDRGERLLREWMIAADAPPEALAAVLLREVAADAAIAHRLGGIATDESARLLQQLEGAADKRVRKEAKRALYRLQQRGIRPAVTAPAAEQHPAAAVIGATLEGYLSPVDGRGDQLVWLLKPQPGAVAHLFAVINDPDGLREVALSAVTRKTLKALQAELERKHELRLVRVDWHYADFLMHRAFGWARARGTRMEGDYPALRSQLLRLPPPEDMPPSVFAYVDPAALGEQHLAASAGLLEEPEFRTWFLSPGEAEPFLGELTGVRDSPLVLNQVQQQERYEEIIARAVERTFGDESRSSWERRLYEMAYVFAVTHRRERAEQAVAAARALAVGHKAVEIPFCAFLVRASLAAFFQTAVQQEEERAKSSLIVTPQQAARRRERR